MDRTRRSQDWLGTSGTTAGAYSPPRELVLFVTQGLDTLGFTPQDNRGIVSTSVTGALAYLQMGRARKMAGDEAAASKFYEEFLTLWKQADPDIPIYRQARTEHLALRKGSTGP